MNVQTSYNPTSTGEEESVDLLELTAIFLAEWKIGVIATIIVFFLGALVTFTMTPRFEATATLVPNDDKAASGGLSAVFSTKSPSDVYLGLLSSRTVADKVIDRVHLMELFHTDSRFKARTMLASDSKFLPRKDTLVEIQVRNPNASTAASIANAYLDALAEQQEAMAIEQATARRHIFERQVQVERSALATAELDLEKSQVSSGLVQAEAQTQLGLSAIAAVRTQITNLQVQMAALLEGSTAQNPRVATLRSEIAQLEAQEQKMESGVGGSTGAGAALPGGKMPEANLEYVRKVREVKLHETLLTALINQYESARLGEDHQASEFEVVDRAIVPEHKSWPPRLLFLLLSLVFGMMVAAMIMVLVIVKRRMMENPLQRQQMLIIRNHFRSIR